jgi:integrase
MSISQKENGKWLSRLQIPTSEKYPNGAIKHKQVQKTFPTKGAAEAWEKQQLRQFRYTGSESTLTISDIAEFREAKKLARGGDLREVARDWASRNPEEVSSTLSEVAEQYESSVEWDRLAKATKNNQKSTLKQFKAAFGGQHINAITTEALEAYLARIPNVITRNNHYRFLSTFFGWCLDRKHRFLVHSPVEAIKPDPEPVETPEFIPLEGVRTLMEKAVEFDSGLIPFLALGFFAGIRPFEIARMEPRDFLISDKRINIRAEVAKPKREGKPLPRLIEGLPDTLWMWLEFVRFEGQVDKTNYIERRRKLIADAGIDWPNSAARHTFSTYAYAHLQNAGVVRKWTGHRNNDSIFLDHYAGLETRARGEEYFRILPPAGEVPQKVRSKSENRGNWPSGNELIQMSKSTPKTKIAELVGVSEAAVRKRLKSLRLKVEMS